MYCSLHVKYPLNFTDFSETGIFLRFPKNTKISNFMKIHLVGAELFHVDRKYSPPPCHKSVVYENSFNVSVHNYFILSLTSDKPLTIVTANTHTKYKPEMFQI